jgi:transposase
MSLLKYIGDRGRIMTNDELIYAVDQYEIGHMSGSAIARQFKVSKQTISTGLIKRGAIKACRVSETVVDLNAAFDRRDQVIAMNQARLMQALSEQTCFMMKLVRNLLLEAGFASDELRALQYSTNEGSPRVRTC